MTNFYLDLLVFRWLNSYEFFYLSLNLNLNLSLNFSLTLILTLSSLGVLMGMTLAEKILARACEFEGITPILKEMFGERRSS